MGCPYAILSSLLPAVRLSAHWRDFSLTAQTRVGVYIDWQNCFRSAQDAFGPGTNGNVDPVRLAMRLAAARRPDQFPGRLVAVHLFSGVPSQRRDPHTYRARRRQHARWLQLSPLVRLHTRALAYRRLGDGTIRGHEKGIDVALAIAMVREAVFETACDVSVLVSADTDLVPALELIVERRGAGAVEVATWVGLGHAPGPLRLEGHRIHQHRLSHRVYRAIEDLTSYGAGPAGSDPIPCPDIPNANP